MSGNSPTSPENFPAASIVAHVFSTSCVRSRRGAERARESTGRTFDRLLGKEMHKALARKLEPEEWSQIAGVVEERRGDALRVTAGGVTLVALRALSCLVEPEPGDSVLLARSSKAAYVLAVLERTGDAALSLVSSRETQLRSKGPLSIVAPEATIATPTFSLHATTTQLHATRVTAVFGALETVLDRIVLRAKQAFRTVEELDHLRAGQVDYQATGLMSLHSENTTLTAEGLVKVDGEQIQLG